MFRKLLAIGLSTVTGATLMVGATALPAHASAKGDACAALPNKIIASGAVVAQATNTLNAANADLVTKRGELDTALFAWVDAVAAQILATDGGNAATLSAANAALQTTQTAVGPKATAWGNAQVAQWNAFHNADVATVVHSVNQRLSSKLTCTAA